MGLLPLLWVVARTAWCDRKPDAEWWMIALGYAVSWVADSANEQGTDLLWRNAYVMLQAGLIGMVLLDRANALLLIAAYALIGTITTVGLGASDLFPLHTVCWLTVAGIALWRLTGTARLGLVMSFGIGWGVWFWFYIEPTFTTWGAYQCTRLIGTALLLSAMRRPFPASPGCAGFTPSHGV